MTKVGLVGCGVISTTYAKTLDELGFVELLACADQDPLRVAQFAEAHSVAAVGDLDSVLGHPDVDIVLNLTPPTVHAVVTDAALSAGKSVFSEKPLGVTYEEGAWAVAAARRHGIRLGCAPDTFLGAGLQTCRAVIDRGDIGEPIGANAFMLAPGPERWHPRPRIFYERGGGPMLDMGPYYITALVHLLGPIARVTGSARRTHAQRPILSEPERGALMDVEVPTHVAAVMEFASGPVGTLVTSFDVPASRYRHLEIYGTEGTLAVPDPNTFGGPVRIRGVSDTEWSDIPLVEPTIPQRRGIGLADMAWALKTGRVHRASGELALHVLDVMAGIIDASDRGAHVIPHTTCDRPAALPADLAPNTFDD